MKPEELSLSDFNRILIGEIPGFFFIELIFRAFIIYAILILSMRLMGKRMSAQISRNEMAAVVSLAAAVGIPLMNPDRGILPPVVITIVIIIFTNVVSKRTSRSETFESLTQDDLDVLVMDGVLNLPSMHRTRITKERIFSQLRSLGILHLGMVNRLYIEANGMFSLVTEKDPHAGLSIVPDQDPDFASKKLDMTDDFVCCNCGTLAKTLISTKRTKCPTCQSIEWAPAVNLAS